MLRTILRWAAFGSLRPKLSSSPVRRNMVRAMDSPSGPLRGIGYVAVGLIAMRRMLSDRDVEPFTQKLKPGESMVIDTRRPERKR